MLVSEQYKNSVMHDATIKVKTSHVRNCWDSQFLERNLNPRPSEYADALITRPRLSVTPLSISVVGQRHLQK